MAASYRKISFFISVSTDNSQTIMANPWKQGGAKLKGLLNGSRLPKGEVNSEKNKDNILIYNSHNDF